ncbi:hydantoinase B/oxoprolinase family protein [Phycicoccus sp. Soil803]|uniref:hydantoinase B/oxoprolinase family protein n=1 Tax=Phycicoccus sp. Soil803 TaxID=1736415 RepID=UPI00070E2F7E|nr:hydantoinase B/oxoprolinase family protein [Phycicoccus sp. Soil803]KRF26061.1 hypothetical protein ASG95_17505 [Phycicoccus sp. Soil803]
MTASETGVVDLEILRHKLQAVTVEMASMLSSGALAPSINEERDFAVGIVSPTGEVVALDNPLRLGALEETARGLTRYFKFDMQDGDVALVSDPHRGPRTVHDWTVLMPLIINSTTVLHLIAVGHVRDVGGMLGGSYYPPAEDVWGEGVPLSPVKVRRYGRPVRDIVQTVLLNSRLEDEVARDLETLVASLHLGRDRLNDLVQRYGLELVKAAADYTLDYTERRVRSLVASWPDGTGQGEAVLTHNGVESIRGLVKARCTIDGERLTIDLSDSDPQGIGFVNSTAGNTTGLALAPLLCVLGRDIAVNSGLTRVVDIVLAPGSLVHADRPAAVGWSPYHCGSEIVEAVSEAFAGALSAVAVNPGASRPLVVVAPDVDVMRRVDPGQFAIGRGCAIDGVDGWGAAATLARASFPSIEAWNSTSDLPIRRMELVEDSAGSGEWRGAAAVEVLIDIPIDRPITLFAPPSNSGERRGAGGFVRFSQDGVDMPTPAVVVNEPMRYRSLRLVSAGGPGYGDPLLRDPSAVQADVLDGLISPRDAIRTYGLNSPDRTPSSSQRQGTASTPRGTHGR